MTESAGNAVTFAATAAQKISSSFNSIIKIETSYVDRNSNNPTKKAEVTMDTWYVPVIDHWVKRTTTVRSDGRVRESQSEELVEFGRR
jgi:hypothetical protein